MSKQITIRVPDDLAEWLDDAPSTTDVVVAALRDARRSAVNEKIRVAYERLPADTPDAWGDATQFSDAIRASMVSDDAR